MSLDVCKRWLLGASTALAYWGKAGELYHANTKIQWHFFFQVKGSLITGRGSQAVLLMGHAAENAEHKQILGLHGPWWMEARRVWLLMKAPKNVRTKGLGTNFSQVFNKFSLTTHLHEQISRWTIFLCHNDLKTGAPVFQQMHLILENRKFGLVDHA